MTTVILLQLLTIALVVVYIAYRLRWSVDLERVAGSLAAGIMEQYPDVQVLDAYGTQQAIKTRYLSLCAIAGLPERAADYVAIRGWSYIEKAQRPATRRDNTTAEALATLYE